MDRIVFILTTLDAHARHRVDDFVAHGFDVHVYAFIRSNECQSNEAPWPIDTIGDFPNSMPYVKRLPILYRGVMSVKRRYKDQSGIGFYYLGLDIAMIAGVLIRHPYIYEECDLNHTYIGSALLRKAFEKVDRRIIRKSLRTIFTSEGFLSYHRLRDTGNVTVIPNKLPASAGKYNYFKPRITDVSHLSFGFAGSVRYETITSFASIAVRNFPQHDFHFFGNVQECVHKQMIELEKYPNCHFHGSFKSPDDFPAIYSEIDFTLATYDTRYENVLYAEPNKIYEAVFFRTPIIVSKGTFLAEKVESLKIGFAVDAMSEEDVKSFIGSLTNEKIANTKRDISAIPCEYAVENNDAFFKILKG